MRSETEFITILKVIARWIWLIVLIVGITAGTLYYLEFNRDEVYSSEVTLIISTPDREDVGVTDEYTFTHDRDEVTTAINKLVILTGYDEVKARTQEELGITENYSVSANAELGADFVYITATASTPELAQQIANTHAMKAIEYFGELRIKPSSQALSYLRDERSAAAQDVRDAETALLTFQLDNNIVILDRELELQYDVLEQLETTRARVVVDSTPEGEQLAFDSEFGTPMQVNSEDSTFETIDAMIVDQRNQLIDIAELEPEYNMLKADLTEARDRYDRLANKITETNLRESFAGQSMFIQIADGAELPASPVNNTVRTVALGIAASLGFSLLLVFFLDYVFSRW